MLAILILGLSVILQVIALVLALRLIRITRGWKAWLLIAAGMLLIVVRRAIHLAGIMDGQDEIGPSELPEAIINLALSIMFVAGVWLIRPLFVRMVRDREALRQQMEELETVMTVVPAAIFVAHDPQCFKITGNRTANELYRVPSETNVSQTPGAGETPPRVRYFQHGRELIPEELPMQKAARGKTIRGAEIEVVHPDGARQVILGNASRLLGAGGEVRGVVAAFMDVTEHRRAEDALRQAHDELEVRVRQRTEELVSANASLRAGAERLRLLALELTQVEQRERRRMAAILHDHLQQLLVAAKLNISALALGSLETTQRDAASKAVAALDEAIAQSRSLVVELSPPVLREGGLGRALEWLGRRMHDLQGLTVHVEARGGDEQVDEDLRIVLFNAVRELLFNVVKHAQVKSADVEMMLLPDNHIQIIVADGGIGFVPAEGELKARMYGGFGLFAIRERLESLGGRLDLDSAPGRGSRLTLTAPVRSFGLPMGRDDGRGPAASAPAPVSAARGAQIRIRVLLADDHLMMRQGISQLLSQAPDIEIVGQVSDGEEAVRLAQELHPDVVVMDVNMPKMDGIEATRIIQAKAPGAAVVGLSMYEEAHRAVEMRQAGAAAYVAKSEAGEALVAAIRACGRK